MGPDVEKYGTTQAIVNERVEVMRKQRKDSLREWAEMLHYMKVNRPEEYAELQALENKMFQNWLFQR